MPYDVHIGGRAAYAFDVTSSGATLQEPLHKRDWVNGGKDWPGRVSGDLPPAAGFVQFVVSTDSAMTSVVYTSDWIEVTEAGDGIARQVVTGLNANTVYHWRADWKAEEEGTAIVGPLHSFTTLYANGHVGAQNDQVRHAFFACARREKFLSTARARYTTGPYLDEPTLQGNRGMPVWDSIRRLTPRVVSCLGDIWYNSGDGHPVDETIAQKRIRCHRATCEQGFRELSGGHGMTFQPDDHELGNDDAEPGDTGFDEGLDVYDQQFVSGYRSIRHGDHVEMIYLETRRYRSGSTLLGSTQIDWLKDRLLNSHCAFRVIVSPVPWNGPDHSSKHDNFCNTPYRQERDDLVAWMVTNGLLSGSHAPVFVVCGDRHKLYHTVSSEGLHEFCVGAANEENAQSIPAPGDELGTDPDATMTQLFARDDVGGFGVLNITTVLSGGVYKASLRMKLYDEYGEELYQSPSTRIRSLPT